MLSSSDQPVPAALRSRRQLESEGVSFALAGATAPTALPITADGTTYTMAQEVQWLDDVHFAVGRWDGSLSVFSFVDDPQQGPIISAAASDPASEGVQMLCWIGPQQFISSSGEAAIAVWVGYNAQWQSITSRLFAYPPALGAANTATLTSGGSLLVVGHANGYMTTWGVGGNLTLQRVVDVRNPRPVNPWGLHNVRGVADLGNGLVVGGSEDGYLSVVYAPSGQIVSQTVYNPAAQRGINAIALDASGNLLVANCAVGPTDRNLWYFTISPQSPKPVLRASVNLRVNPNAPQVFNFSTVWGSSSRFGPCWFSSTEEGALWMGTVSAQAGTLNVYGYQTVTTPLGSALGYRAGGDLVLASYDLYEFTTGA